MNAPERIETDAIRALRHGGPVPSRSPIWGEPAPDGMCQVTFVWLGKDRAQRPMVHINSVTDAHREDLRPAMLDWIPGRDIAAVGYRLPADLVASYRIVDAADLPHDIGTTRPGWMRVHQAGHPDPLCVETLRNPLGTQSSILRGPRGHQHPAERPRSGERCGAITPVRLPARPEGSFGAAWLTVPTNADRLLVAFDGETWRKLELAWLLAAVSPTTALLLIDSGGLEQRGTYLPHPQHVARAVEDAVADARAAGLPESIGPGETIVSGQSYGGLAAGALVTGYPTVARSAIVQSGSFWFRADAEVRATLDGTPGDVLNGLPADQDLTGQRIIVQYGSNEQDLAAYGRTFAQATRERGATVVERQYTGGHDYAWWRTGLLDGLDALAALDA